MSVLAGFIEKMTSIIMEGIGNTAHKAEHIDAQNQVRSFLIKNMQKLEQWVAKNPGRRPPIYFNHETGEVIWLRRTQVRRLNRKMVKARRTLASSRSSAHTRRSSSAVRLQRPLKEEGDERE